MKNPFVNLRIFITIRKSPVVKKILWRLLKIQFFAMSAHNKVMYFFEFCSILKAGRYLFRSFLLFNFIIPIDMETFYNALLCRVYNFGSAVKLFGAGLGCDWEMSSSR